MKNKMNEAEAMFLFVNNLFYFMTKINDILPFKKIKINDILSCFFLS